MTQALGDEKDAKELFRIKENVEKAYLYFKHNYDMFNAFRKLVFDTALQSEDVALLKTLKKPQLEFNILEAYISRLRGEFSKQEPSIEVMAGDEQPISLETIQVVEGHIKHVLNEANKEGCEYQIYTDTLSGGFSVMKVWTEYAHEMSFNQVIKLGRVYDPCLCGFDPLARQSHKGDGNFCFELYPMLKDDFVREYPDVDIEKLAFTRSIEGFNWSYRNEKDDVILMCDYYEKKKKKEKIVQVVGGKVMKASDYKKMLKEWEEMGIIEQPPALVGKPRETEIETVHRTVFIENKILKQEETSYKMLPLVFIDGNSIIIRHANDNNVLQKCRPYVYHARGIQKLKNFAGQTLANELENMVQHKFMVAKEAIPLEEEYLEAYRDVQQADVLVYNQFAELQPDKPLTPPQIIPRVNIPQEVTNTFIGADNLTQNILGNFDMDISRMNQQQTSGVAIVEAATLNNSAAMPYIVGFLQGLNRVAQICIDLIPKYYVTPRTLPIVKMDGTKDFILINQQNGVNVKYGENALNVKVEAGVNFSVQKSRALNQIIALMQASPLFSQFMNTEGLDVLLSNIEIKGIDQIKEMAKQWQEQMRKIQQQQMQAQANQPNPEALKAQQKQAEMQHKMMEMQVNAQIKQMEHRLKELELMLKAEQAKVHAAIQSKKADAEIATHIIDANLKSKDQHHRHAKEKAEFHHKVNSDHGRNV